MSVVLGAEEYSGLLSPAQQGVWVAAHLTPGPAYTIAFAVMVDGELPSADLEHSLRWVLDRHAALRTTVELRGGEPIQVVRRLAGLDLGWPLVDPGPDLDTTAARLLRQQAEQPFDLLGGPLVRIRGVRFVGDRAALLVTVHHLCFDGASMSIFVEDLLRHCERPEATDIDRDPPTPAPRYTDIARWQHDRLADGTWTDSLAYWTGQLAGLERPGAPAADVDGEPGPAGGVVEVELPRTTHDALDRLVTRSASSRFTVLAAALLLLLGRYTGQQTSAIGVPVAQRARPETERMVGLLLNTVVLRATLRADASFSALLDDVRAAVLDAMDHQELPIEAVVGELRRAGSPLFEVMLNYEVADRTVLHLSGGRRLRLVSYADEEAKFPLTVYVQDGAVCRLRAAYQKARYSREQVEDVLTQFLELLRQVTAEPDRSTGQYSLLTPPGPDMLANLTGPLPATALPTVVEMFRDVAVRLPEATAVAVGNRRWSYRDLDERSHHLSQALRDHGVGTGHVVTVLGRPGFGLLAAMLGILRSSAVFMPADPDLPVARRTELMRRAGTRALVVVDDRPAAQVAPAVAGVCTLTVHPSEAALVVAEPGVAPGRSENHAAQPPSPGQSCYLFFTSGTTGSPKPVLGTHAGLAHFLRWQARRFAVGPGDRIAQLTAVGFDPFLRDVLLPLTTGATVCLPEDRQILAKPAVLSWLAAQRVTVAHVVPSLLTWWLGAENAEDAVQLPALRWLFVAGEPLTGALVQRWRKRFGDSSEIVNLYGPTETTQAVCHFVVPRDVRAGVQPIGRPIPGTQVVVLGEQGRRCAPGEVGEICIRTPYRSTGRDPQDGQLLAGFFVNPHRDDPDDLIYRSGDLGRFRRDGVLEVLGRCDDQIKIHGTRIDPHEISAILAGHPRVGDCAVRAWSADGRTSLAVYVTLAGAGGPLSSAELRSWLAERLPRVMVPATVVLMDRLPVTSNGKVNWRALPPPGRTPVAGRRPPVDEVERRMCALMAEVLGRPAFADDDFFDLGGHSLLLMQLICRVEEEFGARLALAEVYHGPTPAQLAEVVRRSPDIATDPGSDPDDAPPSSIRGGGIDSDDLDEDETDVLLAVLGNHDVPAAPMTAEEKRSRLIELLGAGTAAVAPLSHGQQRIWLLDQMSPQTSVYSVNTLLRWPGPMDVDALRGALNDLRARHEALRTCYPTVGGQPIQVVAEATDVDLPFVDATADGDDNAWTAIRTAARRPFDLAHGPLFRPLLIRRAGEDHVLLLNIHHSIADGWTVDLIVRDLTRLLRARTDGRQAAPAGKVAQYRDFVAWQNRRLQGRTLDGLRAYWRSRLTGPLGIIRLTADRPQPARRGPNGDVVSVTVADETFDHMLRLCRSANVTLYMLLLAAYAAFLYRQTGQTDVIVASPVANRVVRELEETVGYLGNTLPLRVDLSGSPTFEQLLPRVRDTVLGALTHQELTFDMIVNEAAADWASGVTPVCQTMFVLQNETVTVPDEVEVTPVHNGTAKYDLAFTAAERDGGLTGHFEYNADVFDADTAQRMARSFLDLLHGVVIDPETPVDRLETCAHVPPAGQHSPPMSPSWKVPY
jgi:amino acid adenylation domain-containing protein